MPVLVVNRIFNSDVNFNKECYFVYDIVPMPEIHAALCNAPLSLLMIGNR